MCYFKFLTRHPMKEINPNSPVFYANHLRVLKVAGDQVRCQYFHYWDTKDLRANVSIKQIVELRGEFYNTMIEQFGMIPEQDFINEFLDDTDDLDYYLGDDCNVIISTGIQEKMMVAINEIME